MNAVESQTETLTFGAEVEQLLDLVAHSMYSNEEVFLRELISNASDAADKLRYEGLSDAALFEKDPDLKIWIDFNEKNNTITLSDNGIGMSREEVVENIGTIAKSGTRKFQELLKDDQAKNSQLIGKFGVGFYSSFIVADKVVVKTRRAGMNSDQGVYWESEGKGQYTIKNIERKVRGTEITLFIRDEQKKFVDATTLRSIIRKYSDHIMLPIMMDKIESEDDQKKKEEGEIVIPQKEVVNQANALWTLSKSEIKDEQYQELYKHISHDFQDALMWAHNKVEGSSDYISLLYLPKRAPFDLYDREQRRGLKLYVKRVYIMDDAEHFMPVYLRFVKGIVDSNDLPLNISRELLQSNKVIDRIRSGCVKRVLSMIEKMAENESVQYQEFWNEFGSVLKEGPAEDFANKDRIAKLLRFSTTHDDDSKESTALSDYVARMKEGQEEIYYLIADTFTAAKNSPLLEVFRKKGIEVLLLSDRVDEWLVSHLQEFDGKKMKSVSQGEVDLGKLEDDPEAKEKQKQDEKDFADVVAAIKKVLADDVSDVRVTHRLTSSPCCVVFEDSGMTGHMQRMLKAAGQNFNEAKPILEINPDHVLVQKIKVDMPEPEIKQWSNLLFSQALLAEGEQLKDPAGFVKLINDLLTD